MSKQTQTTHKKLIGTNFWQKRVLGSLEWDQFIRDIALSHLSLINNRIAAKLWDLGASGVGFKVWVLTSGVLVVILELDPLHAQRGRARSALFNRVLFRILIFDGTFTKLLTGQLQQNVSIGVGMFSAANTR